MYTRILMYSGFNVLGVYFSHFNFQDIIFWILTYSVFNVRILIFRILRGYTSAGIDVN